MNEKMKGGGGPLVSVIIPCYNCERYVDEAVDSIIGQSYRNLEILICDDRSTDGTYERLQALEKRDSRITLFRNERNKGIVETLNRLLLASRGEYIARMDADDISDAARIEEQVRFLTENPKVSLCGTYAVHIDALGRPIGASRLPASHNGIKEAIKYLCPLYHPTVMARRSCLKGNLYSAAFLHSEDYELWCRLLYQEQARMENIPKHLLRYRMLKSSVTARHLDAQTANSAKALETYGIVWKEDWEAHRQMFFLHGPLPTAKAFQYSEKTLRALARCEPSVQEIASEKITFYFFKHKKLIGLVRLCRFRAIRHALIRLIAARVKRKVKYCENKENHRPAVF